MRKEANVECFYVFLPKLAYYPILGWSMWLFLFLD